MDLQVPEVWRELDGLMPGSGRSTPSLEEAAPSGSISHLVDRLLRSLEDILEPAGRQGAGERRRQAQRASNSPGRRLALLSQRIEGLPPAARPVMQRVLDEVAAQLGEICRIGAVLQAAVRASDLARHRAEQHAGSDALTGLLNRRGFSGHASAAYAQALACGEPVLLMFVDINQMKQINDRGGHDAGDRAILVAAEALRRSFRSHDLLVRWGGDEFAVLSVNNPLGLAAATERIHHQTAVVCAERSVLPAVTLSVGGVQRASDEICTLETLLARADQAMYQHKGRNKRQPGAGTARG